MKFINLQKPKKNNIMFKQNYFYKYLLISLLIFSNLATNAQKLVSIDSLTSYTLSEIDELLETNEIVPALIDIKYAVTLYKLIYKTTNYDGSETMASGLFVVPQNHEKQFPMLSYQHGTILKKDDVPSMQNYESLIGIVYATEGYATTMPDYIGLGDSPGFHPYHHSQTEAMSVIDLLRAAKDAAADSINVRTSDLLFLSGYSHGGHSTMAAHMYIEQNFSDEFTISASTPMAGAYDLSTTQKESLLQDVEYGSPGYLPYMAYAFNMVYDLWTDPSEYFVPPYNVSLDTLITGEYSFSTINEYLPAIPKDMLTADAIDSLTNNYNFKLNWALRQNDVYDWTPQAKMRMFYCSADEIVSPQNTEIAYNKFIENGAQNVSKYDAVPTFGHRECALPAILASKYWMNQIRDELTGIYHPEESQHFADIKIYPNPIDENSVLQFNKKGVLHYKLDIYKITGQIVFSQNKIYAGQDFRLNQLNLNKGAYILRITADDKSTFVKKFVVR